jgi:dipeptidyl aminopeptidase/acylaminoacyl peptidase
MPKIDTAPDALWKKRFRAAGFFLSRLASANPARGLVVTNKSGAYQLYAWDVPSGEIRQLTTKKEGVIFGYISPDGNYVYYLEDQKGNEIGHVVRLPFEGGAPEDVTPELPPYSSMGAQMQISKTGNNAVLLIANQEGFFLHGLTVGEDGKPSVTNQIFHSKKLTQAPQISDDGEIAVITTAEKSEGLRSSLMAFHPNTAERIGELFDGAEQTVQAVAFCPVAGDSRLLAITDKSGVKRPVIWNPANGERRDFAFPELENEVTPLGWSPNGKMILLEQFVNARQQLYTYNLETDQLNKLNLPNGSFQLGYFASDDEIFVHWQSATNPLQIIALSATTGEKVRTVLATEASLDSKSWQSVTFKSADSTPIQGWLALPGDQANAPFPTILHTHGGPTSVMTEIFSAECQAWLDSGFAFFTINYRGSTTFGKKFQDKIIGDLGHWETEDVVAARHWLVNEGIANPKQIFLSGHSYGGYLTLMGLGKYPECWAGGTAGIAVADWTIQYEDTSPSLRGYQLALFGGTPQEKPEVYTNSSPITYVDKVSAPVQIIQGSNDTRTPARPVENYVARLKELGKPHEIYWFDAGHMGAGIEKAIEHQQLRMQFALSVLGIE